MHDELKNLEKRMNIVNHFENEVKISRGEHDYTIYAGEVFNLNFKEWTIWGDAKVSRYDLINKTRKNISLQLFPPKIIFHESNYTEKKLIWEFYTNYDYIHGYKEPCGNSAIFLSNGELKNNYDYGYRSKLKSCAVNHEIGIFPELFDMIFNPIDTNILDLYRKARG
ncbi:MAG: hypothetical protein ACP5NV_01310 [Candidatus Woesearchaeota archaeon]